MQFLATTSIPAGMIPRYLISPLYLAAKASGSASAVSLSRERFACNAEYGFNGWLGLATIGLDSQGHIVQGTAKVNDSYASYWQNPEEKQHVICQEIGHLFGLGHTSDNGSSQATCMDYSSDPESQWPNDHDFEELLALYSHPDTYNSYATETSDSGGDCNAPAGRGCNKVGGASGGGEVPPMGVRVLGSDKYEIRVAPRQGGGLWIHHVRLAEANEH